jgi:peptidoglycan/xylan/chitin deacetylase (PgdA/CDA1 family)
VRKITGMKVILKKYIFQPLVNTIPFKLIKRISSCKVIIVYYHIVSDESVTHVAHLYKHKNIEKFTDDIEFLLKNYILIKLSDIIGWVRGKNYLAPNCFLLTFDDGFREIYDVIAPILFKKGIAATFFISSAFLDNRELCYQHKASLLAEKINKGISTNSEKEIKNILFKTGISFYKPCIGVLKVDYRQRQVLDKIADILMIDFQEYLNKKRPYLKSEEVNDLINQGFTIGAHSIDHPYYSNLSLDEQLAQTIGSVKYIRDSFGLDYGAFAFPHNDRGVSLEFFRRIQESGLIDITFGTGGMIDNDIHCHRQRVSLEDPLMTAKEIIAWQYARKLYKRLL